MRISHPSQEFAKLGSPNSSGSSSEPSLQLPLKQLERFRPHFAAEDCFSLLPSMKFCTIFAKQTELGSTSAAPALLYPSLLKCDSSAFSEAEIFSTLVNCRSKSRLNRDFAAGLTGSNRVGSSGGAWKSIGWIFIGNGVIGVIKITTKRSYPPSSLKTELIPEFQSKKINPISNFRFYLTPKITLHKLSFNYKNPETNHDKSLTKPPPKKKGIN